MGNNALKIEHFTSDELRSLLTDDDNFQQAIRLFACYQVSLGVNPKEVASFYGTSYKSICNWVTRLNEGGIEALIDHEPGSIKEYQLRSIKEVLIYKQPYDYGFNTASWSWSTLSKLILHQFQVSYKQAQLYNILRKLGLKF